MSWPADMFTEILIKVHCLYKLKKADTNGIIPKAQHGIESESKVSFVQHYLMFASSNCEPQQTLFIKGNRCILLLLNSRACFYYEKSASSLLI